jgi:hypothetical protein
VARFYRISHHNPPTEDDFKSQQALGLPRPEGVEKRAWAGTSMHDNLAGSRKLARRRIERGRPLGHYIAAVELPDAVERMLTNTRDGHHNVWAPAAELLGFVAGVVEVESDEDL